MAKKYRIEKSHYGFYTAVDTRGNIIATDKNEATVALAAHHWAHAPSLMKRLGFKKKRGSVDGTIEARPFWGVRAEIVRVDDGTWQTLCEVDGEVRPLPRRLTRKAALEAIEALGREKVMTHNILNPEAGEFEISRASKGGCCDPGTETYHCM